jgi:hypothetical protein
MADKVKRKRRTKAEMIAARASGKVTPAKANGTTKKRKRRTKAEIETERQQNDHHSFHIDPKKANGTLSYIDMRKERHVRGCFGIGHHTNTLTTELPDTYLESFKSWYETAVDRNKNMTVRVVFKDRYDVVMNEIKRRLK